MSRLRVLRCDCISVCVIMQILRAKSKLYTCMGLYIDVNV